MDHGLITIIARCSGRYRGYDQIHARLSLERLELGVAVGLVSLTHLTHSYKNKATTPHISHATCMYEENPDEPRLYFNVSDANNAVTTQT